MDIYVIYFCGKFGGDQRQRGLVTGNFALLRFCKALQI